MIKGEKFRMSLFIVSYGIVPADIYGRSTRVIWV